MVRMPFLYKTLWILNVLIRVRHKRTAFGAHKGARERSPQGEGYYPTKSSLTWSLEFRIKIQDQEHPVDDGRIAREDVDTRRAGESVAPNASDLRGERQREIEL